MDFWDAERGIIYGDPIKGQMVLLETRDGGMSWQNISAQNKIPLDSRRSKFCGERDKYSHGKGRQGLDCNGWECNQGYSDRHDYGLNWEATQLPIVQGKNSTGPFSLAFYKNKAGVAAGGDFLSDTSRLNNLVLTKDGGRTWVKAEAYLIRLSFGYRIFVKK
jgi:photosystem II stability/assembly factor-like uncharacterized protein